MLVLIVYDVNTVDAEGEKRLRKVAKTCVDYGQRVQNSVFECILDGAQLSIVKHALLSIIDSQKDSLRIYKMGNKTEGKIECYGKSTPYKITDELIF